MPGGCGGPASGVWFAGGKGDGKGPGVGICFTCGGNHVARECPLGGGGGEGKGGGNIVFSQEPKIQTTQMDFSRLHDQDLSSVVPVGKALAEHLMTPDHRRILAEESGANIEWRLEEGKVSMSGSAEQVKRAQRLIARVMMHSRWGHSEAKIRCLLKPKKLESVLCRLSPMDKLRSVEKMLTAQSSQLSIGKDRKLNTVSIQDVVVSRQHAVLKLDVDRGAVYVLDCSTNGTFLNGVRLPTKKVGKVMLWHGDELLLKDPKTGDAEFGYIVNLTEIYAKDEAKLEAPRRKLTAEEMASGNPR